MPTNVILEEIIKQITKPSVVVDVGCDHCYLAINLLQQKIATFVYNIDIAKKPLASGISNLRKAKLLDYTKNICNDGFSNLHEKIVANYCVISGIG
jgi:tRNA (adenine22-N1)-methyltransferase